MSVALCTYDGQRFVEEQLRSILAQDTPPDELVISDDASNDDTMAIVRRVVANGTPSVDIRIIGTSRAGGVTANFERAVRACRGDIIILSDQDDVWHPDRVSTVLSAFAGPDAPLLVFADANLIDASGASLPGSIHTNLRLSRSEARRIDAGDSFAVLIRRNVVTGAVTAFSRSLLDAALPFPPDWVHDEWLAIIAAAIGTVRRVPARLIDYRIHDNNQIGVDDPSRHSRLARMLEPRKDRYQRLSRRSQGLADRLARLGVNPFRLALARRKASFESARATYPNSRLRRVAPVLRQWFRGNYARLSSQRRLDVARDLLQPS